MKLLFALFLTFYSPKILAQVLQSALINSASQKIDQIDIIISKGEKNDFYRLQDEILQLADKIDDKETRFLIYDIAINKYFAAKCFKEAIYLSKTSLEKAIQCYGEKHKVVATFLHLLAFSYSHNGQIQEAIDYEKKSIQMFEEVEAVNDESYLFSILLLTTCYNQISNYPESIAMLRRCLKHINPNNIPPEALLRIYRLLAANYSYLNNFSMAQIYTLKALKLHKNKQSLNYLWMKQNLAWHYSNNGNHKEAIQTINEVCDILKLKDEKIIYASALCDKASIYINTQDRNNIIKAIQFAEESTKIFEAANDTLSENYIHSLIILAETYRSIDFSSDRVLSIHKKIYGLRKQILDITNKDNLKVLLKSAVLANNLQDGLTYYQELRKRILQEKENNSIEYADIELIISEIHYLLHDYENAVIKIREALPIIRNTLAKSFYLLDDKERAAIWNKYIYIFNESIPSMCYTSSYDKFSELLFDELLLSKGILLNTEILIRKLVKEEISIDDYISQFYLKWQDVQSKLEKEDIAIEFVKVNLYPSIPAYLAVTIRHGYEEPKLTKLFIEDDIELVSDTLYYQCKEMSDLVWKPLLPELKGIKNIYFSPAGVLHNIGIEYLPNMEEYNIYRLSSTRELALKKQQQETSKKAVLYGGLKYYAELDTTSKAKSMAALDETFIEHANVRSMGLRGGMEDLKHTKIEVDRIGKEFKKANWICLLDTASMGTEESFKYLSGKRIGSLHIATHGFYYTKEEADNTRYQFMLLDNNNMASAEDKALTRSGLLLSGANHILEDHIIPDNVEDGILTAKEIAEVDLRGLDLVVLSACQTGLGDIAQGEGVFGLQRGFKKAGANTILMSLWKVDDEATEILMTQFYKNWLSGQSKHQSLLNAQKNLREYRNANGEQCYNSPKYWAAFILLDGIK